MTRTSGLRLAAGCVSSRELRGRPHTVHEVVELRSELFSIISSAYGLVLLSRTTAVEPTVALDVTRTCLLCIKPFVCAARAR